MKKLLILSVCLGALYASPVLAQTGVPQVTIVRIYDEGGIDHLVVVRPDGSAQTQDLTGKVDAFSMTEASKALQSLLTTLYQEGYEVKSTFTGLAGSRSTLIFVKSK